MKLKRFGLLLILVAFTICICHAQQQTQAGQIRHFENFPSKYVAARNVDVWLPKDYSPKKKYAVLYMHDGQMLYDSNTTWNKKEWGIDETMSLLQETKKIIPCIVVGIWNSGTSRHADYLPQKAMESLPTAIQDSLYQAVRTSGAAIFNGYKVQSDAYLKFLVTELKPFIDSSFSTRPQAKYTFVAGSSMGGLISMYAFCEYPLVFGGAACFSTHWPGIFTADNPLPDAFLGYLKHHLPVAGKRKLYFDYGTATLDALYEPFQKKADAIVKAKGYGRKNWITLKFEGAPHSEEAWQKRFGNVAVFLMRR